jgi:hypothetical protein
MAEAVELYLLYGSKYMSALSTYKPDVRLQRVFQTRALFTPLPRSSELVRLPVHGVRFIAQGSVRCCRTGQFRHVLSRFCERGLEL